MNTINNGGPAFPRVFSKNGDFSDSPKYAAQEGMSLRDYFAAKALQGMSANTYYDDFDWEEVAKMAFAQADAMLADRGAS